MEHFPFEQFVGLIVFVIIALSQLWGKLRQGRQMPEAEEPEFEFPDFGPKPPQRPGPTGTGMPQLDEALREALGFPPAPRPSAPAPQPAPMAHRTMERSAPPPLMAPRPPQPPLMAPAQRPAPAPAPAFELHEHEGPQGGVLESLDRLERETAIVRKRLPELGRATEDAGGRAEARMQAHLAGLTPTLAVAAPTESTRARSPLAELLADRPALRRAIVLNEILGPPRAMHPM